MWPRGDDLELGHITGPCRQISDPEFIRDLGDVIDLDDHPNRGVIKSRRAALVHLKNLTKALEGMPNKAIKPVQQGEIKGKDGHQRIGLTVRGCLVVVLNFYCDIFK
jgi:hypothetical protein